MDDRIAAAMRARTVGNELSCEAAFEIAQEMGADPLDVGATADVLGVRLIRCQLGLFGCGEPEAIVRPAEEVSLELEAAIREGLVHERLPCAVAWEIAARLGLPRLEVANAAERLAVRIGPCQLGAF